MKTKSTLPTAGRLAERFAGVLKAWLSPDEWREMCRLNATDEYSDVCASQDFCDANEAMLEAFHALGVSNRRVLDNIDRGERINLLWNEAWDIAKQKYLTR